MVQSSVLNNPIEYNNAPKVIFNSNENSIRIENVVYPLVNTKTEVTIQFIATCENDYFVGTKIITFTPNNNYNFDNDPAL